MCVCVCVCGIVLRRRGRAVVGEEREAVCRRALTRARAGAARLPYMKHHLTVTFHALRL
jgi:hypothetical protein